MEMTEQLAAFEKNRQYLIDNRDILRKAYGEKCIAIVDKNVVDSDKDKFGLAKRMYQKFPDNFVFMSTIEDAVNPKTVAMESPESAKRAD
ncbi:MAG: hypothetical protein PHH54_03525 [Candidatus Nanoarchaeia archaeon]|nr:hypothetical protein [Candidatus Nanoarchaeia archaeon]MDD5741028.1 hypothetical protein [Candidatus Nanoarchaeia archaeon]